MALFGGSKSTSSTTQTDGRQVSGEASQLTSTIINGKGNVVDLTMTDHGAVSQSLQLALRGIEGAQTVARETQAASGDLLSGALSMVGRQQQEFTQTLENIKTSDVRVLVVAGLAVVGISAAMLARGK